MRDAGQAGWGAARDGDSPVRWVAIPRTAASAGGNIKVYGADGVLLATTTDWLR